MLAAELMYRTIIVRKKISLAALLDTLEQDNERGSGSKEYSSIMILDLADVIWKELTLANC